MKPLVIAHRGASARETENSLAAFRAAKTLGADAVELDVHATRDGAIVVHHDERIGRTPIARMSFTQIRAERLPNGELVPTLAEALDAILPLAAFVEVKNLDPSWDDALLAAFDGSSHPDRIAVHSFDHRIVRRLGGKRPDLSRGVLSASYPIDAPRMMRDAGAKALWQEASLVDEALVTQVHGAGGVVYPWTVDDPETMRRLLAMGVDGLCSNHPDRARHAIDSQST